jgi:hypothetical protein
MLELCVAPPEEIISVLLEQLDSKAAPKMESAINAASRFFAS